MKVKRGIHFFGAHMLCMSQGQLFGQSLCPV
jgi:hypothetical protein